MLTIHHASAEDFKASTVSLKNRGITLAPHKWLPGNMDGFFVSPLGEATVQIFPFHTVVYEGQRKDVVLDDTGGTLEGFLASQKTTNRRV